MNEMLLTVEQAAARLQLHPVSVRKQLKEGRLRGIQRGGRGRWRIPESALTESSPAIPGAETILAGLKSGNMALRNAAIITLSQSDLTTRNAVLEEVERETARLSEDDGLEAWRALDSDSWDGNDEAQRA